jgi:hypothetical protein
MGASTRIAFQRMRFNKPQMQQDKQVFLMQFAIRTMIWSIGFSAQDKEMHAQGWEAIQTFDTCWKYSVLTNNSLFSLSLAAESAKHYNYS